MLYEYTTLGVYAEGSCIASVGAHVYGNVQTSQENVKQKHLLCQSISESCIAGLYRPDDVFFAWKQEIQHDDSRFMVGRCRIARDVDVGDPYPGLGPYRFCRTHRVLLYKPIGEMLEDSCLFHMIHEASSFGSMGGTAARRDV
jgi:hypothetical protein